MQTIDQKPALIFTEIDDAAEWHSCPDTAAVVKSITEFPRVNRQAKNTKGDLRVASICEWITAQAALEPNTFEAELLVIVYGCHG
jgi:hypothetical protein